MSEKPDLPIESQSVRVLTDEEYLAIAKGLRGSPDYSGSKGITWEDIQKVARAVLKAKPRTS